MTKYKQSQQENVFINHGKTLATFCAFKTGINIGKSKIRYEVRAGRMGTGRVIAKATCVFLLRDQERAIRKIAMKVGGIEFMNENNINKFEAADYIPDPFERG